MEKKTPCPLANICPPHDGIRYAPRNRAASFFGDKKMGNQKIGLFDVPPHNSTDFRDLSEQRGHVKSNV